jgi:hypothetical protein
VKQIKEKRVNIRRILRDRSMLDIAEWGLRRSLGIFTGSLRLLPDFIIIGAQRSGTTSLYKYLSQHPEIHPSFPKEINYFSNYYRKGINWYRSHFPLSVWKRRVEGNGKQKFITGEATPYYLSHPHAPQRAYSVVPHARLIILLRNPVERAYSHFNHEVRMRTESLSFEQALNKEEERLSQEVGKLLSDEDHRSFNYQHYSYLSRGVYIDQIQAWRRYFIPESILILSSEEFYSEPSKTLSRAIEFFELSSWHLENFKKYNSSPYQKMDSNIRKRLAAYYKPHNKRLYEYLDVDLGWEKSE